jgi:hypothetical protein
MYVLVKSKSNIDVKIKYVDTEGNILKNSFDGGKYSNPYTHNMQDPFSKGGQLYSYTGEYSYTFHSKASDKTKTNSIKGSPIAPKLKLVDVKDNTIIYLTLVYEKKDGTPSQSTDINIKYMEPKRDGAIRADSFGSEMFDEEQGIPTTETLYGLVHGSKYLYSEVERTC